MKESISIGQTPNTQHALENCEVEGWRNKQKGWLVVKSKRDSCAKLEEAQSRTDLERLFPKLISWPTPYLHPTLQGHLQLSGILAHLGITRELGEMQHLWSYPHLQNQMLQGRDAVICSEAFQMILML